MLRSEKLRSTQPTQPLLLHSAPLPLSPRQPSRALVCGPAVPLFPSTLTQTPGCIPTPLSVHNLSGSGDASLTFRAAFLWAWNPDFKQGGRWRLTPKIILACMPDLPAFLERVLQARGLTSPGQWAQSSGMPETPVTRDWGGVCGWRTETVDALSGPLLQVGGCG